MKGGGGGACRVFWVWVDHSLVLILVFIRLEYNSCCSRAIARDISIIELGRSTWQLVVDCEKLVQRLIQVHTLKFCNFELFVEFAHYGFSSQQIRLDLMMFEEGLVLKTAWCSTCEKSATRSRRAPETVMFSSLRSRPSSVALISW